MPEIYTVIHTLLASALRASTGYSNAINVSEYSSAILYLDVTTKEGTAPKLDLTVQTSPNGEDWFDTASVFVQSTAEVKRILALTSLGGWLRLSYAVTGTDTPKFTFSLKGAFKAS